MRRPPNLMKTTTAARPALAPADPGPPSNYLDLYGLSKSPFGAAADGAGYILFPSHRRAFELLVDHMMNGSGMILLAGESGVGKTQTMRAAAAVASESGIRSILVSRPADGRITLEQLTADLDGDPESFSAPPRKALLADDLELMPSDCVALLASLSRQVTPERGGSTVILSTSGSDPARTDLTQLTAMARNTVRLARLGPAEVRQYIERSLWIAGGTTRRLITPDAMKLVIANSGGLPGKVNQLMEAAFTAGFARGDSILTGRTVGSVIGSAAPRSIASRSRASPVRQPLGTPARGLQVAAMTLLFIGLGVFLYKGLTTGAPVPTVATQRPADQSLSTGARPSSSPSAPAPSQSASASAPSPTTPLPPAVVAALLNRGNEAVGLGDIAAARLLFQRAADAGSAAAATAMGKTYDPSFATGGRDPARASQWYRKAIALGDPGAADLLKHITGS